MCERSQKICFIPGLNVTSSDWYEWNYTELVVSPFIDQKILQGWRKPVCCTRHVLCVWNFFVSISSYLCWSLSKISDRTSPQESSFTVTSSNDVSVSNHITTAQVWLLYCCFNVCCCISCAAKRPWHDVTPPFTQRHTVQCFCCRYKSTDKNNSL